MIISSKSNTYNPVYTKDKPWEEQVEEINAKNYLKFLKYRYWSNEAEQEKIIKEIMKDEIFSDFARNGIWSNTFPEVQLKHTDILIELLEKNEYILEVWENTDERVKENVFEKDIESIKDDDVILKICEITNTDILVKNSEKIPFIVEAYVNKGKFLGIHIKKAINQIAEDKEKIIDIMMKANFKARREIFLALDNKHKEKILKELIEKYVDGKEAIDLWECCCFSEIQENNIDIMYALIEKYPNLIYDLIRKNKMKVIIANFEKMMEDDRIAIKVWGKTSTWKKESDNVETFQEKNDIYFEKLIDKYPGEMPSILLGTEKDVQYR